MDAEIKVQWKWKFYRLALHLNAVLLFVALTAMAFILVPEPYRLPAIVALILLDVILVVTFRKKYHTTKAWLEEHVASGKNG